LLSESLNETDQQLVHAFAHVHITTFETLVLVVALI